MTQAERVLSKFKNHPDPKQRTQEAIAKAVGVSQSTVAMWLARGYVPARQQQSVLDAAKTLGIALSPADFFDVPEALAPNQTKRIQPKNDSRRSNASCKTSLTGSSPTSEVVR